MQENSNHNNIEGNEKFIRTEYLLGKDAMTRLHNSTVAVFGLGGVGGYALEALVRSGVGSFILVDFDTVSESNLNRQILATKNTVGMLKTKAASDRAYSINPDVNIVEIPEFVSAENIETILKNYKPDYIIDAIDTVTSKISLIKIAKSVGIPIISSMGTGNKLCPELFTVTDIKKTHTCPLARVMRKKLAEEGIDSLDVLYSAEQPIKPSVQQEENGRHPPASVSFVPSVAGLIIGGYVVKKLSGIV